MKSIIGTKWKLFREPLNIRENVPLTAAGVDAFSARIEEILGEIGVERQNRLRIRLSLEEALLRFRDRFGEEQAVRTQIRKRHGNLVIQAELKGDPCNPLSEEENELADLSGTMLTSIGINPQYVYDGSVNTLRIQIRLPGMNPVVKLLIALLLGALLGWVWKSVPAHPAGTDYLLEFFELLFELWNRILNVLSGPVIFLAVITAVVNSGKIAGQGGSSRRIIIRYFLLSFLASGGALLLSHEIYPLPSTGENTAEQVMGALQALFAFVPRNFVEPFAESNTPQLVAMAMVLGEGLHILGARTHHLSRLIRQANILGLQLAELVSRLVPSAVCLFLALEIRRRHYSMLSGLWSCVPTALLITLVYSGAALIYTSRKEKVPVYRLLLKLKKTFFLACSSGSLDTSYGEASRCCVRELGIQETFTSVSLPNGLVLYMPVSAIGTIVFLLYAANKYGIDAGTAWYVTAVVLSVVLFVATPPVPGANLLAYIALFAQAGIPADALICAMIFDVFFGIFANAANQSLLQLDLVLQADRIGLLNRKALTRSIKKEVRSSL